MNRIAIVSILVFSVLVANESLRKAKNIDNKNFIDNIQSNDPDIQIMIDRLKKDYQNQKDQVHDKYEIKKETLRKQKKQEMDHVRETFRKKIRKLKEEYPKQIHSNNSTAPIIERKHVKPFDKKNSKFEDPRSSTNNLKGSVVKTSKDKSSPINSESKKNKEKR